MARVVWWFYVRVIFGVLLILAGVVWFLQGIGVLPGSFMTGEAVWAWIGGACMALGALIVLRARRR